MFTPSIPWFSLWVLYFCTLCELFLRKKRMSEWLAYSAALILFCTETSDFVRRQVILYGDK